MRASRNERGRRLIAAAALALLTAIPAAAQSGRPFPLLPAPIPLPAPSTTAPATAAAPASPSMAAPIEEDGVTAVPLAPVDSSWAGPLGESDGGLPREMWRGTPRSFIAAALPLLAPTTSPALQDLSRRLLLSDALSPSGEDPPDRPSLLALRIGRLASLGLVEDTAALIGTLPEKAVNEELDRRRIELRFAAQDSTGACRDVQDRIAKYQGVWWDRALIACQALAGDNGKAGLGLSLLREQKAPPDPSFDLLVESLGGRARKIEKLPDPTPMRLALLAAAKQPLPAEALAHADPIALHAWAVNESVPPAQRLAAAEQAALLGALPPSVLGSLYTKIESKPEEQTALLRNGKSPDDPRSRAILFDIGRSAQTQEIRAAALASLLAAAHKQGSFPLLARLAAPSIADLPPTATPEGFAADAARALILAGKPDQASAWIEIAKSPSLKLLAQIAAPSGEAVDLSQLLHDSIADLGGRDSAAMPQQADMLLAILAGFDARLANLDWAPLLAPPHQAALPSAALWIDEAAAARGKRIAETALVALLVTETGGKLSGEPIVIERSIRSLRAVGLEKDARAVALEAALAAGI